MKNTNINKAAFWPALVCLCILVGAGIFATDALGSLLNSILYGMADRAGWFFELFAIICIILTFVLAFSKFGSIKIGGPDAKPDFKTWNWITMSLCGGIGTGLLFWAMGEPIYHFMTPPVAAGVEAGSRPDGGPLSPVLPVHALPSSSAGRILAEIPSSRRMQPASRLRSCSRISWKRGSCIRLHRWKGSSRRS